MFALLPEYLGIGSLFGLYFAVALTVRSMTIRSELSAIEAIGMSPWRWMRGALAAALAVSLLLLAIQGWLMPAGEMNISRIKHDMAEGIFGLDLVSGDFVALGNGGYFMFDKIDVSSRRMNGLFLSLPNKTITARSGTVRIFPDGMISLEFDHGQLLTVEQNGVSKTLNFTRLSEAGLTLRGDKKPEESHDLRLKGDTLPQLVASHRPLAIALAGSRLLWPLYALLAPFLGFVFGKPPTRSEAFTGVMSGAILLILFLQLTTFVGSNIIVHPLLLPCGAGLFFCLTVVLLLAGERRHGPGFVDAFILGLYQKVRSFSARILILEMNWRNIRRLISVQIRRTA